MKTKIEKLNVEGNDLEGQHKQAEYAAKDMQLMHLQVHQEFEKCKSQIQSLQSTLKVNEERQLGLKLKLQDLLVLREDELEKKLVECRALIMSELNKLSDEHIDKSLNLKTENQ